jgi:hypothetical protein
VDPCGSGSEILVWSLLNYSMLGNSNDCRDVQSGYTVYPSSLKNKSKRTL